MEVTPFFSPSSLRSAPESLLGSKAHVPPSSESILVLAPGLGPCTWTYVSAQGHDEGGAGGSRSISSL